VMASHEKALQHIAKCDECFNLIFGFFMTRMAAHAGSTKSTKKAKASQKNGLKGGRPRKSK